MIPRKVAVLHISLHLPNRKTIYPYKQYCVNKEIKHKKVVLRRRTYVPKLTARDRTGIFGCPNMNTIDSVNNKIFKTNVTITQKICLTATKNINKYKKI